MYTKGPDNYVDLCVKAQGQYCYGMEIIEYRSQ